MRRALLLIAMIGCGDEVTRASDAGATIDAHAPDATSEPDAFADAAAVESLRLLRSDPPSGAQDVPRTTWIVLEFTTSPYSRVTGFTITCDGARVLASNFSLSTTTEVILNPTPELPASARCIVRDDEGATLIELDTAADGPRASVIYDRSDRRRLSPFPDDAFRVVSATVAPRLAIPVPEGMEPRELALYQALIEGARGLDGWSPLAHIVVELTDTASVASLPRTIAESLDPFATIKLRDLDTREKVPFRLDVRDEVSVGGATSHSLLIFPGIPLEPGHSYALVVTNRALVAPGRPLVADEAFARALAPPVSGEPEHITRIRETIAPALPIVESASITPREDLALLLRFTIRTLDRVPDDPIRMREIVTTSPRRPLTITSTEADGDGTGPVALIVRGTFQTPAWRDGDNLARDANGLVAPTATVARDFVLALPRRSGPAPVVLFQHGNPGSAESVIEQRSLVAAGFAVIGFTDVLNREISPGAADPGEAGQRQVLYTLQALLRNHRLPELWLDTTGQQLALIHASKGAIDLVEPFGVPDLDVTAPLLYHGVSEGAVRGTALVAYAPEIHAAAITVGGARLVETLIHQAGPRFVTELGALLPNLTPAEIWAGLTLFQMLFDDQDGHVHARFYDRQRIAPTMMTRPSLLVTEGIGDSFIPNSATESLAYQLRVPQLLPAARYVPFLGAAMGPVQANLDAETTAAFFQYVPSSIPDLPVTPGCEAQPEGHYCPQNAGPAVTQRLRLFESALSGVPEIIVP